MADDPCVLGSWYLLDCSKPSLQPSHSFHIPGLVFRPRYSICLHSSQWTSSFLFIEVVFPISYVSSTLVQVDGGDFKTRNISIKCCLPSSLSSLLCMEHSLPSKRRSFSGFYLLYGAQRPKETCRSQSAVRMPRSLYNSCETGEKGGSLCYTGVFIPSLSNVLLGALMMALLPPQPE